MADVLGIREPKIPLPAGLLWVSAWTKELLSRYLTKSEPYPSLPAVEMSIKFTYVNSHKAKQELGFIPQVNFKRSIENAYQWYVEQGFVKDTIVNG
jgi:dihydroflavonol-4-reductase